MRFLILGGTGWLGGNVARDAVTAGHEVVCVARGSGVPSGARLVNADRNLDDALAPLAATAWDAVVDIASEPGHVRRAVRDLASVARNYVYVSTCSVYPSLAAFGIAEDAPLHSPLVDDAVTDWSQQYGPAKVACETAVRAAFGPNRSVIVRPGLIGGPGDKTGRSTYWPLRFARSSGIPAKVLIPDIPDLPTSVIDVRDLAAWLVRLAEGGTSGIFNAAGESIPLRQHLTAAQEVAGYRGEVVAASSRWLANNGLQQWAGSRSLPLWLHDNDLRGIGALSSQRALAAGLVRRPLADTLADTLAWGLAQHLPTANGSGLTDAEERDLLASLPQ
ncbi:MAG: NAD-dependent epimerase/dehydratase family protein [Promicromonosporaceae bacterium]|nr:NAD-dependent epimerase/dehydratase family protein [Promicromonosporaceae bacterium]